MKMELNMKLVKYGLWAAGGFCDIANRAHIKCIRIFPIQKI